MLRRLILAALAAGLFASTATAALADRDDHKAQHNHAYYQHNGNNGRHNGWTNGNHNGWNKGNANWKKHRRGDGDHDRDDRRPHRDRR